MKTVTGYIQGFNQFFSEEGFVILQVTRAGMAQVQTFVFDGYDSMEKIALENPDIPLSVWETLTTMQSESNAALGLG